MIVDKESFTDLAIRLKLASDGILHSARSLTVLSGYTAPADEHAQHHWMAALGGLEHALGAIMHMEQLMTALLSAQDITPSVRTGTA